MSRSIIHVFQIAGNLQAVTHALATIEGLSSWWTKDVTGSAEANGILQFRFADVFKPDMKVLHSSNEQVQWQCIAGEKDWAGDIFTFAITDKGKSVTIKFTQEYANDITDEQFGTFNFNWGYYLYSLKRYCETGQGTPWYNNPVS